MALLAGLLYWRRPRVWLLVSFAFAMHMVEDYFTVGWSQHPWQPFSASAVNLADYLANWMVQGVFQVSAMVFILGITVWTYLRQQRTPLEILSSALDRMLVNYAVLPWRQHCRDCPRRARFRCDACGQAFCPDHARTGPGLAVRCASCSG